MKKSYILSVVFAAACMGVAFNLKTSGGHPSSTGAPGELTCANATTGCHATASITNDNTNMVNTLTFPTLDSSYVPGQTYTINLKAQKSGIVKFGFEIVALRNSNNSNSGTWTITDANRTQIISGTGSLSTRKYVTHTTNGTPAVSSGLGQWTFNWTAPSTNVGNITFYYATNCTNNNAANTGDQLYLSSFQIHPFVSTTGIAAWINEDDLFTTFDPSTHEILLNYSLRKECRLSVTLSDILGKTVQSIEPQFKFAGKNCDKLNVADISGGVYMVNLAIDGNTISKKIIIQ